MQQCSELYHVGIRYDTCLARQEDLAALLRLGDAVGDQEVRSWKKIGNKLLLVFCIKPQHGNVLRGGFGLLPGTPPDRLNFADCHHAA